MLADQPHVDTVYLDALIECYHQQPEHIIVSGYKHKKGVPAIFPKHQYQELLKLEGDKGAGAFLNSQAVDIIAVTSKEQTLMDIDTPEDYNDLLEG